MTHMPLRKAIMPQGLWVVEVVGTATNHMPSHLGGLLLLMPLAYVLCLTCTSWSTSSAEPYPRFFDELPPLVGGIDHLQDLALADLLLHCSFLRWYRPAFGLAECQTIPNVRLFQGTFPLVRLDREVELDIDCAVRSKGELMSDYSEVLASAACLFLAHGAGLRASLVATMHYCSSSRLWCTKLLVSFCRRMLWIFPSPLPWKPLGLTDDWAWLLQDRDFNLRFTWRTFPGRCII